MKKRKSFEWEGIGKLKIRYDSEYMAALRFFPSKEVIDENIDKKFKKAINNESTESLYNPKRKRKDEEFLKLSKLAEKSIRAGDYYSFACIHKKLAKVLRKEGNYLDEMKSRIIAFFYDSEIDQENLKQICYAMKISNTKINRLLELYLETIREENVPAGHMTRRENFMLFVICIEKALKNE